MPSSPSTLDPTDAAALLARQADLQAEATYVLTFLRLPERLAVLGTFEQIGSSVSGLMVWPDLDVMVRGDRPDPARVTAALAPVMAAPGVLETHYFEQTGPRSPSGKPQDERHYFVLRVALPSGRVWKVDVSIWRSDAPRPQRAQAERFAAALTPQERLAILWIKSVWCERPEYPEAVGGTDVYEAVLRGGARSPADFETFLRNRAR